MKELKLVRPSEEWRDEVESYKAEFQAAGDSMDGTGGLSGAESFEGWLMSLRENSSEETVRPGLVPATTFLGVRTADERVVGMVDLRHRLNEHLLQFGGHAGYSVRPTERQKGYAKELLRLGLEYCKALGIDKVLITCDRENTASARTILANGGILENEVVGEERVTQRYRIALN